MSTKINFLLIFKEYNCNEVATYTMEIVSSVRGFWMPGIEEEFNCEGK